MNSEFRHTFSKWFTRDKTDVLQFSNPKFGKLSIAAPLQNATGGSTTHSHTPQLIAIWCTVDVGPVFWGLRPHSINQLQFGFYHCGVRRVHYLSLWASWLKNWRSVLLSVWYHRNSHWIAYRFLQNPVSIRLINKRAQQSHCKSPHSDKRAYSGPLSLGYQEPRVLFSTMGCAASAYIFPSGDGHFWDNPYN